MRIREYGTHTHTRTRMYHFTFVYLFSRTEREQTRQRREGERKKTGELPDGTTAADAAAYRKQKRNERWPRVPGIVYQRLRCK